MKRDLFIYGAGGLGREILSFASQLPEWNVVGFIDDMLEKNSDVNGFPVLGDINFLLNGAPMNVVLAFGDPNLKRSIATQLHSAARFPSLLHPSAIILDRRRVDIGEGTIVCAGTIITTNVKLGTHVLLNLSCTIGHDVSIGDCSSLMPSCNLAGGVKVGRDVLIGSGSDVRNLVCIGDGATIGMGSVVLTDVPQGVTCVGVPAKQLMR